MKQSLLSLCLLLSLSGAARAESPSEDPSPAEAAEAPTPVPGSALDVRRQELEARRKALETEFTQLASDVEAQAKAVDPKGQLTSAQIFSLLQQRESRLDAEQRHPGPYLVAASFFFTLMMSFAAWLLASHRKAHQLHTTVRLMVEKGAEIPLALLAPPPRRKPSDLRRGILLSMSGLGLTIFLAALPDTNGAWGAGVTLLTLGLGHLLVWRLQQGRGPVAAALSMDPQA